MRHRNPWRASIGALMSKGAKGIFRACLSSDRRWRSTSPIKYRVMWKFASETRATPRFQVQVFWYRVSAARIGCGGQMARKMRASPPPGSGEAFSWAMAMLWVFYDESACAIVWATDRKDKGPLGPCANLLAGNAAPE